MRKQITLAALIGIAGLVNAQSYVYTESTGTTLPYFIGEGTTTTIFEPPTSSGASLPDQLSSMVPLPFSWDFYGSAVSGYYASDNGYITFENSSSSPAANDTPPTAGDPNSAIYAFWDDIEVKNNGSGTTDRVKFWTYGSEPNRVHVVQWHSVTPGASGGGTGNYLYAAIRIYECGDFDIVHQYSDVSGMSATVGCENAGGTDATLVTGSPSLDYPGGLAAAETDDKVYSFYYGAPPVNDLQLISETGLSTNIVAGTYTLTGAILNSGSAAVSSFDLNYSVDGGSAITMSVNANISANGGSYTYSHSTQLSATTAGVFHEIKIWASNINGSPDELNCNDTLSKSVFVNNGLSAGRKILLEEFTGTWCGYCPDGHIVVDDNIVGAGYNVAPVMIHSGDVMAIADGEAIDTYFDVTGYPGAMIDRTLFSGEDKLPHSRGAWAYNVSQRVNAYSPAYVAITNEWNGSNQATVTVTANFIDYAAGDMRLNLYVIEDGVTGGSSYDQSNYMNATAGHPLNGAGNPIVGYVHNDVLRAVPSGPLGTTGVIPSPANPGGSYSQTYTYTVPSTSNPNNMYIIGFASYINSGNNILGNEIINVSDLPITVTNIGEASEEKVSVGEIYPNPTSTIGFLDMYVGEPTITKVEVCNVMGQMVKTVIEKKMAAGKHAVAINVADLTRGLYYANIYFGEEKITKKFVVIK